MGIAEPSVGVVGVLLALSLWAPFGEPGALGAAPEVPPPVNVMVESYNFNTSVCWDYPNITSKPLFSVEVHKYGKNLYRKVDTCVNISQHCCDLTHTIQGTVPFWVRVKALVGIHESQYEESKDQFYLYRHVRIGPPELHCSLNGNHIQVELKHPRTPFHKKSVYSYLSDFTYDVFFWERGHSEKRHKVNLDGCTRKKCTINLTISSWNTVYCVSAVGHSMMYLLKGEKSEESCIEIPLKSSGLTTPIVVGSVCLIVLAIVLIIAYTKLKKRKIQLPRSLLAVVKGVSLETKPESKYISVITEVDKPVSPESEERKSVEEFKATCAKDEDADGCQRALSKGGELSNPEGTVEEILEDEQNPEDNVNYFKSVSGQGESSNSLPILDLSEAEMQQPTVQENFMKVSGYDKPHWKSSDSGEELLITESR
ncbi:interferon gamma receptor 1 [Varanus komodoensis]|uniref:Interferon gamma receptor 1 n=1 Tax=Varanus komodoensis TaxID=61221 RepID=A0A8D2KWQ8_VARKO|nr:interferon gamma receptor 1 [Varanus komodoensis]